MARGGAAAGTAVTRAEMQALDRLATERFGVPSLLLMENAGRGIAQEVAREVRRWEAAHGGGAARVLIVCGRGNNGGDGYVVARHLLLAGVTPRVLVLARRDEVAGRGDPSVNLSIAERLGVAVLFADPLPPGGVLAGIDAVDVVVDAIFGTGLSRPVEGVAADVIRRINGCRPRLRVVAVDIPSGLDCDTGAVLGVAVEADVTVTVAAPKVGFFAGRGSECTGDVRVVDFGCPLGPLRAEYRARPAADGPSGP